MSRCPFDLRELGKRAEKFKRRPQKIEMKKNKRSYVHRGGCGGECEAGGRKQKLKLQ
jgi:hypothetical protein